MYRLLKFRRFYSFNSQVVTSPYFNQPIKQTCSLCKHNFPLKPLNDGQSVENAVSVRFQSTNIHTAVQNSAKMKKKKTKRPRKKYAELVEVTEGSTNQTKASVQKLKPKHLTELVKQPDINLAQLYTLKKSKPSSVMQEPCPSNVLFSVAPPVPSFMERDEEHHDEYDSLPAHEYEKMSMQKELDILKNTKLELVKDPELLQVLSGSIEDVELKSKIMQDLDASERPASDGSEDKAPAELRRIEYDELSIDTMATIVPIPGNVTTDKSIKKTSKGAKHKTSFRLHQREQMAKVKQSELEKAAKEECLYRNLKSYLEVCVNCGFHNRALYSLLFYHSRSKHSKHTTPANEIKLFNILLHGFASSGNVNKMKEVVEILHKDKVPLTTQSFAALLECAGRLLDSPESDEILQMCVEEMKKLRLTFREVMQKSVFVSDQREMAVSAVKKLLPDFEPVFESPDTSYSCSLVDELNATEGKKYRSPAEGLMDKSELQQLAKEQMQTELNNFVQVKTIEKRTDPNETILYYREKLEQTQRDWKRVIRDSFHRDVRSLRAHNHFRSFRNINLYPYLRVLDVEDYVEIIMQEIRKLAEGSETFSPTTSQLYRELGNQVRSRYEVRYKAKCGVLEKVEKLYEEYCAWYLEPGDGDDGCLNTRQKWQQLVHQNALGTDVNLEEKSWPTAVQMAVGRFLYNIIMKDIKIDVNIAKMNSNTRHYLPAFYTLFRSQGRTLKEEVKPHPILARLFRGAAQENLVFDVTSVPMVCPPLPWTSITSGSYLIAKADLIRLPQQATQQWQILKKTPLEQLYPSLDSLNELGSIPWTVNQQVLDVVIEVFNSGGSQRLDVPEPPSSCPQPRPITEDMTKAERFHAYRERVALRRRKAEMYSLWCDALYRLSLANHFRDRVFWLPHNMDFRGRVYPCPPHLNHLGSDMARALLIFAKGEPLGKKGLDWLKIHLVNLTGLKKRDPVYDRLQYAEELMPEVMDSAENPLTGRMLWATSEEPWQTLACCMAIAEAVKSGDPESYVCHFPVHQDGSCNGLQHYAALGRDKAGAESVNLTPAHCPQDVYSCVSTLVERERSRDAEKGLKIAQVLDGFVRRKVIKQTVMTTVYGVTRYGARLQIARQLKDIENFPQEYVWQASTYLVGKTFESLQEMFTSTKQIQDWFTECARMISQVCGQNVEWVTPLGLPIVQPYSRVTKKLELVSTAKYIKQHYSLDMFERPNVMKQKNAFPPNFIHSLDSSHMMLTSLFCERAGITFVSVHDCFWTHPSTVDVMNQICRQQFVALHSQPILEDLSDFLVRKYSYREGEFSNDGSVMDNTKRRLNRILTDMPSKGNLAIESVLDSIYFFS